MKDCQEEAAPCLPGERCEALARSPVPGCPGFLGPRHAWLVNSPGTWPGVQRAGGGRGRCSEFGQEETKSAAGIRLGAGGTVTRNPPVYKTFRETYKAGCLPGLCPQNLEAG